jgi:FeS assembly SUF system protein
MDASSPRPEPSPPEAAADSGKAESVPGFIDLTVPREGEPEGLRDKVVAALRTCYDPEIPVNIYELGLIYDLRLTPEANVELDMTLTSPACPVAGSLPGEVEAKIRAVEGVNDARVELTWEPTWSPAKMSEVAKLELNMF